MSPETKAYLELVVSVFEARLRGRKAQCGWFNKGSLKLWEQKVYNGAKKLLREATK